eukprot:6181665-Prymnesium_polylepis.2
MWRAVVARGKAPRDHRHRRSTNSEEELENSAETGNPRMRGRGDECVSFAPRIDDLFPNVRRPISSPSMEI